MNLGLKIGLDQKSGGGGSPPPPPVIQRGAVNFDGSTFLTNAALVCTDNGDFSFFGRFQIADWNSDPTIYYSDPAGSGANYLQGSGAGMATLQVGDGSSRSTVFTPPLLSPGWHTLIISTKTDLAPSPTADWWVAISADGTKWLAAAQSDFIYSSSDGAVWTKNISSGVLEWNSIATSADGALSAAVGGDANVYISTAGGDWTPNAVSGASTLVTLAMSSNGSHIVVGDAGGFIYVSTDSGASWTQRAVSAAWGPMFVVPDGSKMYAIDNNTSDLYRSVNSGTTWAVLATPTGVASIAASADGTKLIAGTFDGSGALYVSLNSGGTWTDKSPSVGTRWYNVTCSPNWETVVAGGNAGFIWTSQDDGNSWGHGAEGNFYRWVSVGVSADGSKLIAGAAQDGVIVHTSVDIGATWAYRRVISNTRILVGYVDDVRAISGYTDVGPAFDVLMNGLVLLIGADSFGDNIIGDVSELWIAPGVSLLVGTDISVANRRKFITADNKPVDATGWPASPVAFYGNAPDWEAQAAAQGFAITGTLTTAPDGL